MLKILQEPFTLLLDERHALHNGNANLYTDPNRSAVE